MKDSKNKALVKLSKKSFINEHKHLLKVLKTGKGKEKEYKEQKKELKNELYG